MLTTYRLQASKIVAGTILYHGGTVASVTREGNVVKASANGRVFTFDASQKVTCYR